MQKAIVCFLFVISAVISSSAQNLKADMTLMMKWFEGRFDNFAQTVEERESKAEFPHERIHSIFAGVQLPAFGENVFYVQQFMDGDPGKIYRQRLYSFTINKKESAIELKIFTFPDEKAVMNAHLAPSKLKGLTIDKMESPAGCEVYWKRDGDKFAGTMKPNACKVVSKRSGKTLIISDDLFLSKDYIWINDQARDDKGNYVFGNKSGVHHKLNRVRMFQGWTAVLRDGTMPMMQQDAAAAAYDGQRDLEIYDQGGMVRINEKYSAQLAQLSYKGGANVLKLGIVENTTGMTIAYTWANPDAEKIGINLRWIQAGFSLKK
jgi:hypothetical protein